MLKYYHYGYQSYKDYLSDCGKDTRAFIFPEYFRDCIPDCTKLNRNDHFAHISIYIPHREYAHVKRYFAVDDVSKLFLIIPRECFWRWQYTKGILVSHIPMYITWDIPLGHDTTTNKTWYRLSSLINRIPEANIYQCEKQYLN